MNKLLLLLVFISTFAESTSLSGVWKTDFDAAQMEAKSEGKQILLYFSGSDWCKPCIQMKKFVLDTEEFLQYADKNFILIQADFPRLKKNRLNEEQKLQNEGLAELYNKEGIFPLLVLLTEDGRVVEKIGYQNQTPEALIDKLSELIKK